MSGPVERLSAALAGRYRIERELGAGGMATVYLAEDQKHDRKVAIKVLHEDLGATLGPERFLAEIKTTAKLQHPHVLPLLDSGSTDVGDGKGGLLYYVMPFVDGESLRDRLDREKQLPIDDAVRLAREIGDALAMAHGHGIIHRDIKPENILLQGGHALVADFGIALAVQHAGGARLTQTGLSLGTPQYMAPEQAMGEKSVDARADIYALGAVTYEMLVGEPPFTGATVQAIVAKVLSSEPEPPTTMRKTIPHYVEDAVLTALAKLPADRFADVRGFTAALGSGAQAGHSSGARNAAARARTGTTGIARGWAVAGVTLGVFAGVALGYGIWRGQGLASGAGGVARTYVMQPRDEAVPGGTTSFVLSPDGEDLVYVGPGEQPGTTQLWRKRRSELHATRIAGTVDGYAPFYSPDGQWLAYYSRAGLIKQSVAGGAPVTLASGVLGSEGRGAWLDDGRVVFADRTRLEIVSADGGKSESLVTSVQMAGYNPVIVEPLPGSAGIVMQTCPSQCPRAVIYSVDLRTKAVRMLIPDGRNPTYLPSGHLAWITSAGVLVAAPFDADKIELRGEPVPVLERVSALSVSARGRLAYREGDVGEAAQVAWVDRAGRASILDSSWVAHISSFGLSPDGRRLATSIVSDGQQQLWIKELPRGTLSKFTFGTMNHFRPVWSADARRIWYVMGDSSFWVMEQNTDGSGAARPVKHEPWRAVEAAASRDGNWLVLRTGGTDTTRALLGMRLGVDSAVRRLESGPGSKLGVAISPDTRFIAFSAGLSGRSEVYVSPFPNIASSRWQVSASGGFEARWSNDGRELFYVNLKNELVAVKVNTTSGFSVVSTEVLFDVSGYVRDGGFHVYEQEPGGNRFLMLKKVVFPGELVLVDNWFAELREKLKRKR